MCYVEAESIFSIMTSTLTCFQAACCMLPKSKKHNDNMLSVFQVARSMLLWRECSLLRHFNFIGNACKKEIEEYLTSPNIPHTSNPFLFWKTCYTFPRLRVLALRYLSYKPSSVNSERLFSTAGLVQTPKRNRLIPQNLQMLCFLNKNLTAVNFEY